jgi:malate permease and related proteins
VVGLFTALILNSDPLVRDVGILQISVPTALFTAMFAEEFGGESEVASGIILMSSLFSLLTLSVLIALLLA